MTTALILKKIGSLNVFFRNPEEYCKAKNQPQEPEKMVKLLTNEEFEDYDGEYNRRLKHPEHFEIVRKYQDIECDDPENTDKYTCLCTENSCSYLMIVRYKPNNIYFALGSVCYTRFSGENSAEVYYHCKAKKCNECKIPLVFKVCKFSKNTDKKCEGKCYGCVERAKEELERVYLKVHYDVKDDAKSMGARWNPDKKKWYAPNNSAKYKALIEKYL